MHGLLWALLLLVALVALPGLAQASPADPSWIPGVYDEADGDDVVTLVASGAAELPAPVTVPSFIAACGGLVSTSEPNPAAPGTSVARSRAPPVR
jgi:hypothetical protein